MGLCSCAVAHCNQAKLFFYFVSLLLNSEWSSVFLSSGRWAPCACDSQKTSRLYHPASGSVASSAQPNFVLTHSLKNLCGVTSARWGQWGWEHGNKGQYKGWFGCEGCFFAIYTNTAARVCVLTSHPLRSRLCHAVCKRAFSKEHHNSCTWSSPAERMGEQTPQDELCLHCVMVFGAEGLPPEDILLSRRAGDQAGQVGI